MSQKKKYTFEQYCIDNNRQDLLSRWDYEKTGFAPSDITYSSAKDVYFKCPLGIHESEKRKVYSITGKHSDQKNFICKECSKGLPPRFVDLSGKKFGQITVIEPDKEENLKRSKNNNQYYWKCVCDCGRHFTTYGAALKDGRQVTCGNRAVHHSGSENSNWKGGITSEVIKIRNSELYKSWRRRILGLDEYKCVACGDNHNLEVHHIYPFSQYKEFRFLESNGITLCKKHHCINQDGSFHKMFGAKGNIEQLDIYINLIRKQLGLIQDFNTKNYIQQRNDSLNNYIHRNIETNFRYFSIPISNIDAVMGL